MRAGVDMTSYIPGRPLSRAISDPKKFYEQWQQSPAELYMSAFQPQRGSLVDWQVLSMIRTSTRYMISAN